MRGRNEHEYLAAHGVFRRGVCPDAAGRRAPGGGDAPPGPAEHREPEHTYSAPVQTIPAGEGITLPLAAALAWLLR